MKRRRWTDENITAYLDGRMTAEERRLFEAALAGDRTLRVRVEEMQQVKRLLASMPMREPPRTYRLTPAMVAARSSSPRRKAAPFPSYRWASAMAMVFLIAFGLLWALRSPLSRQAALPPTETASQTFAEAPAMEAASPAPAEERAPMMGAAAVNEDGGEGKGISASSPLPPSPPPTLSPTPSSIPSSGAARSGWFVFGVGALILLLGGLCFLRRAHHGR